MRIKTTTRLETNCSGISAVASALTSTVTSSLRRESSTTVKDTRHQLWVSSGTRERLVIAKSVVAKLHKTQKEIAKF